jgi:hypothetical protein
MVAMNPSNTTRIGQLLSEIRDLYGTLRDMTKRFLDEFSVSSLQDLVRERALVLLKINSEEDRLLRISDVGGLKQYGEFREINDSIAAILAADREITTRVTSRMNSINSELALLSDTSSAAKTYTRHCRC